MAESVVEISRQKLGDANGIFELSGCRVISSHLHSIVI
jgi:hypothetical protein